MYFVYPMFSEICIATISKLLLKYVVYTELTVVRVQSQCKYLLRIYICFGRSKPEDRDRFCPRKVVVC
jgi:hypothetical protein